MAYENCIKQLGVLLEATDPNDQINEADTIQKFAAACALVEWSTRDTKEARDQFRVFLSYYEIFALKLEGSKEITKRACEGELIKLTMHLPKQ